MLRVMIRHLAILTLVVGVQGIGDVAFSQGAHRDIMEGGVNQSNDTEKEGLADPPSKEMEAFLGTRDYQELRRQVEWWTDNPADLNKKNALIFLVKNLDNYKFI